MKKTLSYFNDVLLEIYYRSQIAMTTGGFELWTSYKQYSYLIHYAIRHYGVVAQKTNLYVIVSLFKPTCGHGNL